METSTLNLILGAGIVVKLVLLTLLGFSVASWAIIIYKAWYLRLASKEDESFTGEFKQAEVNMKLLFEKSKRLRMSPVAGVFREVFTDRHLSTKEELRRALTRYETLESGRLERYLSFLATTGSTTPFIGLFGTVWGIMNSFHGIGSAGSASLAVVAPGIAEALIATAVGLAAAIPAVIAYNFYLSRTGRMILQMQDFSEDLLDLFARYRSAER